MGALSHAEREFEILGKDLDPDNMPIIWELKNEILALVAKFGDSGQSGGSAPFTASAISQAIKHLCMQETVGPLTGEDWEWNDMSELSSGVQTFQNNRNSAIFKDGKDGRAYYLDAITFCDQTGGTWHMNSMETGCISKQYIKAFPFYPKRFSIDVISTEVRPEDWESTIKDPEQLKAVWEVYDPMEGMENAGK